MKRDVLADSGLEARVKTIEEILQNSQQQIWLALNGWPPASNRIARGFRHLAFSPGFYSVNNHLGVWEIISSTAPLQQFAMTRSSGLSTSKAGLRINKPFIFSFCMTCKSFALILQAPLQQFASRGAMSSFIVSPPFGFELSVKYSGIPKPPSASNPKTLT